MGFFEDLSESIVSATKDVTSMAQTAGENTKLLYEKKTKEAELAKLFEALGKKVYEEQKETATEGQFDEIEACLTRINWLNEEMMKNKGGKACPKCGTLIKTGASFCSNCGEKLDGMFEE
ncbi:MAG: zinc ribbon domain-containing protein [Pseudobutyrivibrio sp.]|nr:zinc ribbon domain-containing protein [Pseudobutyrivibrio sp.]